MSTEFLPNTKASIIINYHLTTTLNFNFMTFWHCRQVKVKIRYHNYFPKRYSPLNKRLIFKKKNYYTQKKNRTS